jgi:hypothetical protein
MAQIGRRLMVREGCATPCATAAQLVRFEGSATKRNHGATARNHGATEAQPAAEDRSATAQPAAYRQPVRLRVPGKEKGSSNPQGTAVGRKATEGALLAKGSSRAGGICGSRSRARYAQRQNFLRAYNNDGVPAVKLFSAYGAAQALEKDRQTIERAVLDLTPDGYEGKSPRWRLARIVDRLARNNGADVTASHDLQRKFAELEAQYNGIQNAPTLAERRKRARAFFPFLAEVESAMYADAKRHGEDPRMTHLRVAEHTRLNLFTLRQALGWTSDKIFAEFLKADPRVHDDDRRSEIAGRRT